MKITYLGDIMPLRDEEMRPRPVRHLAGLKGFLSGSDFVVANLESPISHEATSGSHQLAKYRFVTPYEVAEQVRDAGVTHVSVCNNHSIDQGFGGLMTTLDCVREAGLVPLGACRELSDPTYAVLERDGIRVAVFATTYGTNTHINHIRLTREQARHLNLTQEQELFNPVMRKLWWGHRRWYWRSVRFSDNKEARWPCERKELSFFKRRRIAKLIREMLQREKPDVFVMYPHEGGQHRREPMKKAHELFGWLFKQGADAIICNHEHLVQKAEMQNGRMVTFCLGNVVSYLGVYDKINDNMENLSVILHQYLERNAAGKVEMRYTFSVAKTFFGAGGLPETRPMHELIAEATTDDARAALVAELNTIGSRFTGHRWEAACPTDAEHPFPAA